MEKLDIRANNEKRKKACSDQETLLPPSGLISTATEAYIKEAKKLWEQGNLEYIGAEREIEILLKVLTIFEPDQAIQDQLIEEAAADTPESNWLRFNLSLKAQIEEIKVEQKLAEEERRKKEEEKRIAKEKKERGEAEGQLHIDDALASQE